MWHQTWAQSFSGQTEIRRNEWPEKPSATFRQKKRDLSLMTLPTRIRFSQKQSETNLTMAMTNIRDFISWLVSRSPPGAILLMKLPTYWPKLSNSILRMRFGTETQTQDSAPITQ